MATKRWILFLPLAAMIAVLAGCSSGTADVQNPPPPPQSQLKIAFQPEPAPSLAVSFSENLTAAVSSDPNNYGVDWSLTCQDPPNCGILNPPHTASGTATTYTAPSSLSTGSMVVEIVAFATADHTKNVVAPITITTFDSSLQGTYVLQAQGIDANGGLNYQFAGAIVLDGNGGISSGEQTINFFDTRPSINALVSKSDGIQKQGSSYFIGSDGRGILTINTGDNDIGGNGVETFAFVLLSNSQALISQMDLGSAATGTSATGTMDLQTSTAAPLGGYAFAVSGLEVAKLLPLAFGGVFNIDSPSTISGNGSVSDEILLRKVNATAVGLSGTLTTPDQFGAVTFSLTAGFGSNNAAKHFQFTGYIVDDTHIKLIESDNTSGTGFGSTAGLAIGQGSATGTFKDSASFSGTYVFGVLGVDLSANNSSYLPSTSTSVGLFTADGSGNLSNGFTDTFLLFNSVQGTVAVPQAGAQISAPFTGTYSVDSTGTGRASSTSITFNPVPKHGYQPTFFFYLTGNGNPPLVLAGGDTQAPIHYPWVGAGLAYPQSTATPAFSGDYGFSFTQESNGSENDGTAQLNANPTAQTLSGFADSSINAGLPGLPDQSFGGIFNSPVSNGLFPGTLENVEQSNAFTVGNNASNGFAVDYYIIDPGHGFFVETDLVNSVPPPTTPTPSGQVSFGYYAARTPVCASCP